MKRFGLLLLVLVMAFGVTFGVAGCAKKNNQDPVGTWTLNFDWGCDGSAAAAVWHIHSNGTFISNEGNNGNWNLKNRDEITLNYAIGTIYGGTIDGDRMDGTMTAAGSGATGCWTAQKTSDTP